MLCKLIKRSVRGGCLRSSPRVFPANPAERYLSLSPNVCAVGAHSLRSTLSNSRKSFLSSSPRGLAVSIRAYSTSNSTQQTTKPNDSQTNIQISSMHLLLVGVAETGLDRIATELSLNTHYIPTHMTEENAADCFLEAHQDGKPRIFYTSSGQVITSEPLNSLLPNPMVLVIYVDTPAHNLPSAKSSSLRSRLDTMGDVTDAKIASIERLRDMDQSFSDPTWPASSPSSVRHVDARVFEEVFNYRISVNKDMDASCIASMISDRLALPEALISTRGSPSRFSNAELMKDRRVDTAVSFSGAITQGVSSDGGLFMFDAPGLGQLPTSLFERMSDLTFEQRLQRVFEALPLGSLSPPDLASLISQTSFALQSADMASLVTLNGAPVRKYISEATKNSEVTGNTKGAPPPVNHRTFLLETFRGPSGSIADGIYPLMALLLEKAASPPELSEYVKKTIAESGMSSREQNQMGKVPYGVVMSGSPLDIHAMLLTHDAEQSPLIAFIPVETMSLAADILLREKITSLSPKAAQNVRIVHVEASPVFCDQVVKRIIDKRPISDFRTVADSTMNVELGLKLVSPNTGYNLASLVPMITYYVSAYVDLMTHGILASPSSSLSLESPHGFLASAFDVAVPAGDLSLAVAACLAQRMGVPIRHVIVGCTEAQATLKEAAETGLTTPASLLPVTTMGYGTDLSHTLPSNFERLLCLSLQDYVVNSQADAEDVAIEEAQSQGLVDLSFEQRDAIKAHFEDIEKRITMTLSAMGPFFDSVAEQSSDSTPMMVPEEIVAAIPYNMSFVSVSESRVREVELQSFIHHSRISDAKTAVALTAAQDFYASFYGEKVENAGDNDPAHADAVPLVIVGGEHPEVRAESTIPGLYLTLSSAEKHKKTVKEYTQQVVEAGWETSKDSLFEATQGLLRSYDKKVKGLTTNVLKKKKRDNGELYISLTPRPHDNLRTVMGDLEEKVETISLANPRPTTILEIVSQSQVIADPDSLVELAKEFFRLKHEEKLGQYNQ